MVQPQLRGAVRALALGGGRRSRGVDTRRRRDNIVAASRGDEPPPPAPTSSEDIAAVVVVTKNVFASTSSATLTALATIAPARFSAIGLAMFRNGGAALRHHNGGGGGAYPPTWSLPLTLGVELLAGFLSEGRVGTFHNVILPSQNTN
jgi:hypothetical protein